MFFGLRILVEVAGGLVLVGRRVAVTVLVGVLLGVGVAVLVAEAGIAVWLGVGVAVAVGVGVNVAVGTGGRNIKLPGTNLVVSNPQLPCCSSKRVLPAFVAMVRILSPTSKVYGTQPAGTTHAGVSSMVSPLPGAVIVP